MIKVGSKNQYCRKVVERGRKNIKTWNHRSRSHGEAVKAGKTGSKTFLENLRGKVEPKAVVETVQGALDDIRNVKTTIDRVRF